VKQLLADPAVQIALRIGLALLFARAAWHKLRAPGQFRAALAGYRMLPDRAVPLAATAIATAELGTAVGLALPGRASPAPLLGAGLLLLYATAIGVAWLRGERELDCGCGPPDARRPIGPELVARNLVLAGSCAIAALPMGERTLLWLDHLSIAAAVAVASALYAFSEYPSLRRAALGAAVLALVRQVGILHERISPAGALVGAERPAVGEHAPVFELRDWSGRIRRVGGIDARGRRTLLLFVSPTCPICKQLLPLARSLRKAEGEHLRVVLASDGPLAEHTAFVHHYGLEREAYVLSGELGRAYQVGRLPHAVLLDREGVVRARGLVNSREHLESLLEAEERGVASLQEYLQRAQVDPSARSA